MIEVTLPLGLIRPTPDGVLAHLCAFRRDDMRDTRPTTNGKRETTVPRQFHLQWSPFSFFISCSFFFLFVPFRPEEIIGRLSAHGCVTDSCFFSTLFPGASRFSVSLPRRSATRSTGVSNYRVIPVGARRDLTVITCRTVPSSVNEQSCLTGEGSRISPGTLSTFLPGLRANARGSPVYFNIRRCFKLLDGLLRQRKCILFLEVAQIIGRMCRALFLSLSLFYLFSLS